MEKKIQFATISSSTIPSPSSPAPQQQHHTWEEEECECELQEEVISSWTHNNKKAKRRNGNQNNHLAEKEDLFPSLASRILYPAKREALDDDDGPSTSSWPPHRAAKRRPIKNNDEEKSAKEILPKIIPPRLVFQDHGCLRFEDLSLLIPDYEAPIPARKHHLCSAKCRSRETKLPLENLLKKMMSPLLIPYFYGWTRTIRKRPGDKFGAKSVAIYTSPCGVEFGNANELQENLTEINSILPVGFFAFDADIQPLRRFSVEKSAVKAFDADLSRGILQPYAEIPVFNCYSDSLPERFVYVKKNKLSAKSSGFLGSRSTKRSSGCRCQGRCRLGCPCRGSKAGDGASGHGFYLGRVYYKFDWIMECGKYCSCGPQCDHRTLTLPSPYPLAVYYYPDRGWGVRAATDIPQGAFVAWYSGEIQTDDEVAPTDDKYLMALDLITSNTKIGNQAEKRTRDAQSSAGSLNIDGLRFGNVSRFFNHSCQPNMFAQVVHRDYLDDKFYEVGFFTSANVVCGTELLYDYAYDIGSAYGRQVDCLCGAAKCRGRML